MCADSWLFGSILFSNSKRSLWWGMRGDGMANVDPREVCVCMCVRRSLVLWQHATDDSSLTTGCWRSTALMSCMALRNRLLTLYRYAALPCSSTCLYLSPTTTPPTFLKNTLAQLFGSTRFFLSLGCCFFFMLTIFLSTANPHSTLLPQQLLTTAPTPLLCSQPSTLSV